MSLDSVRAAVLAGKRHQGGLKMQPCLAVKASWFEEMQREASQIIETLPSSEVTAKNHPTYWTRPFGKATQHSLFNKSGDTSDHSSDASGDGDGKGFAFGDFKALGSFFEVFSGRLLSMRLSGLMPASGLSPHEETIVQKDRICLRFHLPVFTDPGATLILDDERFHFQAGIVYAFNKGCVHAAENKSEINRYHLIWDMWLDEWIYDNILDLESETSPHPDLRKLSALEASRYSVSEPCPVNEHVIGISDGTRILAKKHRDVLGNEIVEKTFLTGGGDILEKDGPISIGEGWYPLETFDGSTFRWVSNDAEIRIIALRDGMAEVRLDVEPGPGIGDAALDLEVVDQLDCEIHTFALRRREQLHLVLPVHTGFNSVRFRTAQESKPIGADPRCLSFRVFRLDPIEEISEVARPMTAAGAADLN
jgi:hypothetical protein